MGSEVYLEELLGWRSIGIGQLGTLRSWNRRTGKENLFLRATFPLV